MRSKTFQRVLFALIAITFVFGFLLADASGLIGTGPSLTPGTTIATVNGSDITYGAWQNAIEGLRQDEERRLGRGITLDERQRLEDQAYDQLVANILLEAEYERRNIAVTDQELIEAARYSPPPQLLQAEELQTEGKFDIEKYQRYLASPQAAQSGLRVQLEGYYREEIRKQKLFEQIASDVYITDARLWSIWQDTRDSAQVTFASFSPDLVADSAVTVTDAEVKAWYDRYRDRLDLPGRAVVSVVAIAREVSAADSAATRARIAALRAEIAGGAKFEDVAKRESSDSASAIEGGVLPRGVRGRFVTEFENAAFALQAGELSQPVATPFGYHLIRVDERKGDTIALRHILLRVQQSDSSAARTDRQADELARLAAGADVAAKFDSAAQRLGLQPLRGEVQQGQPLQVGARRIPDVSAWAFGGARVGESSELFSDDDAYYLARVDSLRVGGVPELETLREQIRTELRTRRKVESLVPRAQQLATAAARGSLEGAAQAAGVPVQQTPMFSRISAVPGLGQRTQPIGAAFAIPVGSVSGPISAPNGVYVLRVDRRTNADRAAFDAQKVQQREQVLQSLRQQRVSDYLENLRRAADIEDNRREILAAARATGTT